MNEEGPGSSLPSSNLPSPNLPSSYVSPWWLLGQDLQAVAASLGLRARELWRRSGSGDLPRPPFWPRAGAALFWPLVLVGVLLLLLALGRLAYRSATGAGLPPPLPVATAMTTPAPAPVGARGPELPMEPMVGEPLDPLPSPELALDPLLELLSAGDGQVLIVGARPRPELGSLVLELDRAAFLALPAPQRQSQANLWQQRAAELGYGALDLVEGPSAAGSGRLLGRQARVGTGMILLSYG
jgi:hypothetical protein